MSPHMSPHMSPRMEAFPTPPVSFEVYRQRSHSCDTPTEAPPLHVSGCSQAAWRNQSWRLLCTCCRLVASPSGTTAQQQKPHHQQQQQQHKATGYDRGAGGGDSGIGGGGGDAVIDAAAIRVAVLLTDASAWKCLGPLAGGAFEGGEGGELVTKGRELGECSLLTICGKEVALVV